MKFTETSLKGAFIIDLEPNFDERGFFARGFCKKEFSDMGINFEATQLNISKNTYSGTIRGMHYQQGNASECKLIRCIKGSIWDVIIDVRPSSPTYLKHIGIEISESNQKAVYIPAMFAHGNQTLTKNSSLMYLVNTNYQPEYECGFRPNDPKLGIDWPMSISKMSLKDRSWPLINS
jgi:dTDP-4-dehydrorhamnose 3,5-epimerase